MANRKGDKRFRAMNLMMLVLSALGLGAIIYASIALDYKATAMRVSATVLFSVCIVLGVRDIIRQR